MQPVIDVNSHYDSKNMLHKFVFAYMYFDIYIQICQLSMVDYGL